MKGAGKKLQLGIGAGVILGAFVYMLTQGIGENLVFNLTPGELLGKGDAVYDRDVRLGGQVKPGTVQWDAHAEDLRFTIQDSDGEVRVHAAGIAPPAMFRPGMGAIVEGRYTRAGIFEATTVMVKHSNEYRVPEDHEDAKETYRTLLKEAGS